MSLNNDKKIAASIIERFSDKYLDGNLDNIVTFSLAKLYKDSEFGCPKRKRFDSDDTELMRAIYILIFSDLWPGLTFDSLSCYDYRGDTLNTYNTMFGSPYKQYNQSRSKHPGLDKFNPTDEFSRKTVDFRYSIYSRIGNMAVLPNRCFGDTTINCYRGCNHTHDFFDRFLVDLKAVLINDEKVDEELLALVNHNSEYFEPFRSGDGFKKIIKGMFLEDYTDKDFNPIIVSKAYYFWMGRDGYKVTSEDYIAEANRHLDFSTTIIENRGRKMLNAIKEQLSILT
jgi:hypothetical protein